MSSSIPSPKFLLDENVRVELSRFLKEKGFDVKVAPKGETDEFLASASRKEGRVLVTNDIDFTQYSEDALFSVIWLRIPQNDAKSLMESFSKLLGEFGSFSGRVVVLKSDKWEDFPLGKVEKFGL